MAVSISSRDEVRKLQLRLTEWGFELVADGIYGPKTKAQVKNFQKAVGLKVDGIAGPKTNAALQEDIIYITHFKKEEFKCPCKRYCDGYIDNSKYGGISYSLLIMLERIREAVGIYYNREIPCNISANGGYRCPRYNAQVGGSKKSQHLDGIAADIFFNGVPVSVVNSLVKELNLYGGIGLNGKNITHVDVRGYKARWYYN